MYVWDRRFSADEHGQQAGGIKARLLTTVAWELEPGKLNYALEGSAFVAGAAVQWLRDGLGIIKDSSEVEALAAQVDSSDGVVFVPALTGLGAPYWDPHARGLFCGASRVELALLILHVRY